MFSIWSSDTLVPSWQGDPGATVVSSTSIGAGDNFTTPPSYLLAVLGNFRKLHLHGPMTGASPLGMQVGEASTIPFFDEKSKQICKFHTTCSGVTDKSSTVLAVGGIATC